MIMLRGNDVPLRTRDGGNTWTPLSNFPNVSMGSYTRKGSYSWSGRTFVVHGVDRNAPKRQQVGVRVRVRVLLGLR